MKIITWNVNWIRAVAKKWFKEFVLQEQADFYCLQEVKAFESQFIQEIWYIKWYNFLWHTWEKAWYAWTAILYKEGLELIETKNIFDELDFNWEWRLTQVEFKKFSKWQNKNIVLLNVYFPNWWTRADWTEMLSFKLKFYDEIIEYVNKIVNSWKDVIITWDFNICHEEIDIARPKENANSIWFLPIERAKVTEFLNNWYIDTFREKYPEKIIYSRWSFRAGARPRNVWWRLDYFLVNKGFYENVVDTIYLNNVMWSDHCPVVLSIKTASL